MPQSQLTINGAIVDVTSLILAALSVIGIELIPYPILRLNSLFYLITGRDILL